MQKSEYICREGEQTHNPNFIYNGLRYVLVKEITEEQATEDLLTYTGDKDFLKIAYEAVINSLDFF